MEPFSTNNRPLAFALLCAGGTLAGAEKDGPAVNTYSLGFLRQDRFKPIFGNRGYSPEQAARMLVDRKIPGNVTYRFERDAVFQEFIQAWDRMAEIFRNAHAENEQPELPDIPPAVVAQVLFVAANSEKEFGELPFLNRMRQLVSTVNANTREEALLDGKGEQRGKRDIVEGGGKVWSIFGSQELKSHLKV